MNYVHNYVEQKVSNSVTSGELDARAVYSYSGEVALEHLRGQPLSPSMLAHNTHLTAGALGSI